MDITSHRTFRTPQIPAPLATALQRLVVLKGSMISSNPSHKIIKHSCWFLWELAHAIVSCNPKLLTTVSRLVVWYISQIILHVTQKIQLKSFYDKGLECCLFDISVYWFSKLYFSSSSEICEMCFCLGDSWLPKPRKDMCKL